VHAPEVNRIRVSGLESGRIQHILNNPDRTGLWFYSSFSIRIFKFHYLGFDANTIIKRIFAKIETF